MQLIGFSIDGSTTPGRLSGRLSLPGVSVIVGRNGLGKTLILESVASALQGVFGWGRQSPYHDWAREIITWLQLELAPTVDGEDWHWLSAVTRMNPGPPGVVEGGGFRYRRPGCDVPADEGESFDSWGARVADQISPAEQPDHRAVVEALIQQPVVDVMNLGQGDITLGFVPSRLDRHIKDLAARLAMSDVEDSRRLGLSCLDPSVGFVRLLELGELPSSNPDPWRPVLPPLVYLSADSADLDAEAERVLTEILAGPFQRSAFVSDLRPSESAQGSRQRDPWFIYAPEGQSQLDPAIDVALEALEVLTNELCPAFATRGLTIELSIYPVELWTPGLPRVCVSAVPDDSNVFIAGALLGAGSKRWVLAAMREAGRRLAAGSLESSAAIEDDGGWKAVAVRREAVERALRDGNAELRPSDEPAVLIVDEPELHLHPLAVEEIASWLQDRAAEGCQVLTATHSPTLLAGLMGAALGVLVATDEGVSLREVSEEGMAALGELEHELGFTPSVWLQLTRAVLVVEGQHDLMVIDKFFGDDFERHAVRMLALRGTKNTRRFIDSDFLGKAGIPLRVLFDNVRAEAIEGNLPQAAWTDEEQEIRQLLSQLSQGHDIRAFPFAAPDILCALPEAAVRRAFPQARFPGWDALVTDWRGEDERANFKNFARRRMGIENETSSDVFVTAVLDHVRSDEHPGFGLKDAIVALIDSVVS